MVAAVQGTTPSCLGAKHWCLPVPSGWGQPHQGPARQVGDVLIVIQAKSQRQPSLVVKDQMRALCTGSLQNWNTEADVFMTFIISAASSVCPAAGSSSRAPGTNRYMERWGRVLGTAGTWALLPVLRGCSLGFDALTNLKYTWKSYRFI